MLMVALIAMFAATATWRQWRNIQAETDERAQTQSAWLIRGALDWAKIVLYLDARATRSDDLNEPWAVPLAEAKLATFLTAENNVAQDSNANTDMTQAFFSGGVADLQARLNLTNLVHEGKIDPVARQQFVRLFEALDLPAEEAEQMAQRYLAARQAQAQSATAGDDNSATGAANGIGASAPLMPACTEQLGWLGLEPATIARIRPYVTVLPARTKLNLNTAPELVLYAGITGADQALAAKLASVRQFQPFDTVETAFALAGSSYNIANAAAHYDVATNYFLVSGHMRLDTLQTSAHYVLRREGNRLSTVRRECPAPAGEREPPQAGMPVQ